MSRALRLLGVLVFTASLAAVLAGAGVVWYLLPRLPSIESLKDVRLQVPLRVYSRDGRLIGEFGEKRRIPVVLDDVPETMIQAVLAAEDERFYEHPGVDWQGLARAVLYLVRTGEKGPGGSTITMQVARNFFLGREKTYVRKLNEILLALKIERELSKDEILALYFNKIFLGQRAYGVGAAAQVYYGKPLAELALPQLAMIAGLPRAPSRDNPIADPARAMTRRNYVLRRMHELGFIDAAEHRLAAAAPISAAEHGLRAELDAPFVAEMVRARMEEWAGEEAYTGGYRVYTTVDSALQSAAGEAVRVSLIEYDRRHGYRGPEGRVEGERTPARLAEVLRATPVLGGLVPAVVLEVEERSVLVHAREHGPVEIPWEGLEWARPYLSENARGPAPGKAGDVVAPGELVRVERVESEGDGEEQGEEQGEDQGKAGAWRLGQVPEIEGALVSLDPQDGAIKALVGGFDFARSKFNRAVQAERQPGSAFKPFIYSAALERGFTPASFINDAPVVFDDPSLEAAWRPENYSGKFFGPTRLRVALMKSRNLVSIRLLRAVGIEFTIEHLERFGLRRERLPANLSLALGSATLAPIELARGHATIANGGLLVEPYLIERIVESGGEALLVAQPARVCRGCEATPPALARTPPDGAAETPRDDGFVRTSSARAAAAGAADPAAGAEPHASFRPAPRAISVQNAWLMSSLMRDVVRQGTGRRALQLGRGDLAGKTGTTNDQRDAWFSGFNPRMLATVWVGFDQLRPLGRRETGARAALPIWLRYMEHALDGVPETFLDQPDGIVTVRIDPETGEPAGAADPDAIFEVFEAGTAPKQVAESNGGPEAPVAASSEEGRITEQLF